MVGREKIVIIIIIKKNHSAIYYVVGYVIIFRKPFWKITSFDTSKGHNNLYIRVYNTL